MPASNVKYVFKHGYRCVPPNHLSFQTFAKGRWCGKMIASVMREEFPFIPHNYWDVRLEKGHITVNGLLSSSETILKAGDRIECLYHSHEPPVRDIPVSIIQQSEDMIVVNKPPGIPIYPVGQYQLNSLTEILKREHSIEKVYPVHRIDRVTSGLVLFSKTSQYAGFVAKLLKQQAISKEYLAKVKGRFPQQAEANTPIVEAGKPQAIHRCAPEGRPSLTHFELLGHDAQTDTSLVRCLPKTGRTHQIRVHLSHLGFPIINDTLYGGPVDPEASTLPEELFITNSPFWQQFGSFDPDCPRCTDPMKLIRSEYICLHALRYKLTPTENNSGWDFEAPLPGWAGGLFG